MKIVKSITTLTLAVALGVTAVSCANKAEMNSQNINDTKEEIVVDRNGNIINVEAQTGSTTEASTNSNNSTNAQESEKVGKVKAYQPIDFKAVTDYEAKYDELLAKRAEYYQTMKLALNQGIVYSQAETITAIYNVAQIDNDLSSLLVQIYNQKTAQAEKEIYLADQIEMLEKVLNNMKTLQTNVETFEADTEGALKNLPTAEAEKISRAKNFTLLPLKKPIKTLETQVANLRADLEEALAAQTQD